MWRLEVLFPAMDIEVLEAQARQLLSVPAFDYFAGGADEEHTLRENPRAWTRVAVRPRVLRDVSEIDTATTVLGTPVAFPALVAPMAYQRLAHDEGERAMARGTAQAGTLMIVSTFATVSLEEVQSETPQSAKWFQLYVHRDRGITKELLTRAKAAGYRALVLTVDLPVFGLRRRDDRNGFALPEGLEMANLGGRPAALEGSAIQRYAHDQLDPSVTFDDLSWIIQEAGLPLIVKGVLRGDDAVACVTAGAAAVVVSNHGGRQMDTTVPIPQALAEVVEAVAGRAEVYADGGIRRGLDVLKALALGARAVLLGRPVIWALACGGEEGVGRLLEDARTEFERAMGLAGAASVKELTPDLVVRDRHLS